MKATTCGRLAGAIALVLLPFADLAPAAAQDTPCDPDLVRSSRPGVLGYQSRGEHCEGLFATDVAATTLWVASLTEVFDEYDLESTSPLTLRWSAPDGARIRLRAHGIRRDLYYRMDAPGEAGAGEWSWPIDFLAVQGIERPDIGVLAWLDEAAGSSRPDVFVPLRATQDGDDSGTASARVATSSWSCRTSGSRRSTTASPRLPRLAPTRRAAT